MNTIDMLFEPALNAATEDPRCKMHNERYERAFSPDEGRGNLASWIWRQWRSGTGQTSRVCETAVETSSAKGLIAASHFVRPVNRNNTGKEHVPNCEANLSSTER